MFFKALVPLKEMYSTVLDPMWHSELYRLFLRHSAFKEKIPLLFRAAARKRHRFKTKRVRRSLLSLR